MRPRVSIGDETLSEMLSALEDAASERMSCEVSSPPWRILGLEQSADDAEHDRYPVVCRDGMAPIVVACIRAALKTAEDTDAKRDLRQAEAAVKDAYGVSQVPSMGQALKVLASHRCITPWGTDAVETMTIPAYSDANPPPSAGLPRWLVVLAVGVGVPILITVLLAVLLANAP